MLAPGVLGWSIPDHRDVGWTAFQWCRYSVGPIARRSLLVASLGDLALLELVFVGFLDDVVLFARFGCRLCCVFVGFFDGVLLFGVLLFVPFGCCWGCGAWAASGACRRGPTVCGGDLRIERVCKPARPLH